MAVATLSKTLTVNPAFLQEIKDSNPDLWDSVDQLSNIDQTADEPTPVLRMLVRLLDDLRDKLALQFSLEESYGYIEVPASAYSGVTGDLAVRAQSQHGTLYLRLNDLAEQAEELQYRGVESQRLRELIASTVEYHSDLHAHELLEKELIRRSYDVG